MNTQIRLLFQKLKKVDYKDAFTVESDIFMHLYRDKDKIDIPFVKTFIIVSGWFGTSERSGAWVYYESTSIEDIKQAVDHLAQIGEVELSNIIDKGIHNYKDEKYADTYEYPQEWIDESEEIDHWIHAHEDWLKQWIYNYLIRNEESFLKL